MSVSCEVHIKNIPEPLFSTNFEAQLWLKSTDTSEESDGSSSFEKAAPGHLQLSTSLTVDHEGGQTFGFLRVNTENQTKFSAYTSLGEVPVDASIVAVYFWDTRKWSVTIRDADDARVPWRPNRKTVTIRNVEPVVMHYLTTTLGTTLIYGHLAPGESHEIELYDTLEPHAPYLLGTSALEMSNELDAMDTSHGAVSYDISGIRDDPDSLPDTYEAKTMHHVIAFRWTHLETMALVFGIVIVLVLGAILTRSSSSMFSGSTSSAAVPASAPAPVPA
jgi:hypothetical protein